MIRTVAGRQASPRLRAPLFSVTLAIALGLGFGTTPLLAVTSSISGTVTDAGGAPLAGITVQAGTITSNAFSPVGSPTSTGSGGTYTLSIASGRYAIQFSEASHAHATGFYSTAGFTADPSSASLILVTSVPVTNINVKLPLAYAVSGTVTGPGAVPLAGISVDALTAGGVQVASATTNGSGLYSLHLPSGSYRLRITDPTKTYPSGYYTATGLVTNLADADAVVVAGSTVTGKDIQLPAARHITGTVTDALASPVAGIKVTSGLATATTAANGAYSLTVAAGAYVIQLGEASNAHPAGFYHAGAPSLTTDPSAASAVDVTGADASGIDVQLPTGAHITGTVHGDNGPALVGVEVWLLPIGSDEPLSIVTTSGSGTYSILVAPGSFVLKVMDASGAYSSGFYSAAVTSGFTKDQSVATHVAVSTLDVAVGDVAMPLFNTVTRQSGNDRYATAAVVSRASTPSGPPVVYIATGLNFPDALASAAAAAHLGGPVLLVTATTIPSATATELARLNPDRIVVAGGQGVISNAVVTQLESYTSGGVTRQWGADRYATAADISSKVFSPGVAVAYVATGLNFPDALAAAAAAGRLGGPVLLVTTSSIPAATQTELARLQPARIVIAGGAAVVSSSVAAQLAAYTTGSVERQSGPDRYATAAAISAATFAPGAPLTYVATGANFPDALAAAAAAGRLGGPVLLTKSTIPTATASELTRLQPGRIVVTGGTAVVSDAIFNQLGAYIAS